MMIDRLGGIDPVNNVQNTHKVRKANEVSQSDSISVSSEAKELAEVYFALETAQAAPDVRADRVAEVMQKIKDPSYIDTAVVDLVADRIMDVYGF